MGSNLRKKRSGIQALFPLVVRDVDNNKKVSRGELLVRRIFNDLIDDEVYYNFRPNWLKNPETGNNLELDIYYPHLKLAIEFQGIHHKLHYQVYKDNIKKNICSNLKINLISINDPRSVLYDSKIKKELKLLGIGNRISKSTRFEILRYKKSKSGRTGKYFRFCKRKIKEETLFDVQKREIEFNRRKLSLQ